MRPSAGDGRCAYSRKRAVLASWLPSTQYDGTSDSTVAAGAKNWPLRRIGIIS